MDMVEKAVKETFTASYALIDLGQIFRETKPNYKLNNEQKEKIKEIVNRIKQSLDIIEKELT